MGDEVRYRTRRVARRRPHFRQLGAAHITPPPASARTVHIEELSAECVGDALTAHPGVAKRVTWDQSLSGPIPWGSADNVVLNGNYSNTWCDPMPNGVYITNDGTLQSEIIQLGGSGGSGLIENFYMTGWRFRMGDSYLASPPHSGKAKMLSLTRCKNVRISHCSFFFNIDNEFIGGAFGDSERITYDHNIIAYSLLVPDFPQDEVYAGTEDDHSRAMSIQGQNTGSLGVGDVTLAYNLYLANDRRNPFNAINAGPIDARYNYMVMAGDSGSRMGGLLANGHGRSTVNFVGNRWDATDAWSGNNDIVYNTGSSQTVDTVGYYFRDNINNTPNPLNDDIVADGKVQDTEFPVVGVQPVPPRWGTKEYVRRYAGPEYRDRWDRHARVVTSSQDQLAAVQIINNPEDIGVRFEPAPSQQ